MEHDPMVKVVVGQIANVNQNHMAIKKGKQNQWLIESVPETIK